VVHVPGAPFTSTACVVGRGTGLRTGDLMRMTLFELASSTRTLLPLWGAGMGGPSLQTAGTELVKSKVYHLGEGL